MKDPTVIQAKRYGVYSVKRDVPLKKAARLMADEDISALVVVDPGGFLQGILSRVDLLRAWKECDTWQTEPVENWMSQHVVTVSPRDHLSRVVEILLENHIHRVVAVQETESGTRPVAVLSAADVVYHLAKESE